MTDDADTLPAIEMPESTRAALELSELIEQLSAELADAARCCHQAASALSRAGDTLALARRHVGGLRLIGRKPA